MKVFVGQDHPVFEGDPLRQDSSRTWLVFKETGLTHFELDVLDIREHAHLAVQNDGLDINLTANEYKGDFTGSLHVGKGQFVNLGVINNSVMPFSLLNYKVSGSWLIH